MQFLAPLWFAFWRRFYGANKPWFPSSLDRVMGYSVPLALGTVFLFPIHTIQFWWTDLYVVVLSAAWWAGISLTNASPYWKMMTAEDWLLMAANGFLVTFPVGAVVALVFFLCHPFNQWVPALVMLSGILTAPGYWLGWQLPTVSGNWLNRGTDWGELLGWFFIGSTFLRARTL